jgi:hypothetical protein
MSSWLATRLVLVVGMVLTRSYCDPQFYRYAGDLSVGRWPYHPVQVEYPPVAMFLILLPAIVLLPFSGIAPRPDPALTGAVQPIPPPDPLRYGAYSYSCSYGRMPPRRW